MESYKAIQMAVEGGREVPNEGRSMGAVGVMAVTPRKEYLLLLCTHQYNSGVLSALYSDKCTVMCIHNLL